MLKKISMGFLIAACSFNTLSQEEKNWGADLAFGAHHQEYELVSADMQNFTFTPYYQKDNWIFSANLPWIKVDGDYFVNGNAPRVVSFCSRLTELSPLMIQRLINRGRITAKQVENCNQLTDELAELEEAQSGMGDMSLSVQHLWRFGAAENSWVSLGIEYKTDNGDFEKGLGSGSQDTALMFGVGFQGEKWSNHFDASFTSVSATDTEYEIEDYMSVTTGVAYLFWEKLTWGVDYQFEQAYLQDGEDVKYFSTYLDWAISDAWSLRLNASDYDDLPEYPQTEYGMTLGFSF
jgi:hypothetical protein